MAKNIGSLGRRREPVDLEFDYFGHTVRVNPQASDAVEVEFLEAGRDVDVEALQDLDLAAIEAMDPAEQAKLVRTMDKVVRSGYLALMSSLRQLVHPDDWDTYWKVGADNSQQLRDRMADVKAITQAVVEATTDFPGGRRSGSPAGPATTPPSSAAVSPSPAPRQASDLEISLALERGRPDIQEFYVMEAELREQQAREEREQAAKDRRKLAAAGLNIN
jgi:hypothetical protein